MGNLLLQGWCMLENTCPNCLVPIMRSKAGAELCVICDTAYKNKIEESQQPSDSRFQPQAEEPAKPRMLTPVADKTGELVAQSTVTPQMTGGKELVASTTVPIEQKLSSIG